MRKNFPYRPIPEVRVVILKFEIVHSRVHIYYQSGQYRYIPKVYYYKSMIVPKGDWVVHSLKGAQKGIVWISSYNIKTMGDEV